MVQCAPGSSRSDRRVLFIEIGARKGLVLATRRQERTLLVELSAVLEDRAEKFVSSFIELCFDTIRSTGIGFFLDVT